MTHGNAPMPEEPGHTLDRMISVVSREIKRRERIYQVAVASEKMAAHQARYETQTMRDVLSYLQRGRALLTEAGA